MTVLEHHVGLLKRQLQVLNYTDPFDISSYDLVKNLVTDLVHTTETYQYLKQESAEQQHEIASFRSKIDAIKKDSSRVVRENNALHAQLIQRDEESTAQQALHYQRVKELEGEIAELSFWKHQTCSRMEQSEKVNAELRERLSDLMTLGVAGPPVQDYGRLSASSPMGGEQLVLCQEQSGKDVAVLHAVEQRLAQVQQEVKGKETKLSQITGEMKLLQLSLQQRDSEIQRLSARLEVDGEADVAMLSLRNETNEAIILSLNQQVDVLSSQVAALDDDAKVAKELQSALQKAKAEKEEANQKLSAAVHENASIQEQVIKLQHKVSLIKSDSGKNAKPKLDERNVLEHVTNIQPAQDRANGSQEHHKNRSLQTERHHEASMRRESQLRSKFEGLKIKVEKAEKSVLFQERKVEELRKTLTLTKQREDKGEAKIQCLQADVSKLSDRCQDLQQMLDDNIRRLESCEADKMAQEHEVHRLRSVEAAAAEELVLKQSTIDEVTGEKNRLNSQVMKLNVDRESLQEQLQEAVKLKTNAVSSSARLQGDHDRIHKEKDALQKRLTDTKLQLDSAVAERNQFELQASKHERELKLMREDRDTLKADLLQSRQQWQEHRERLAATEGELGHLSGLRSRSDALETELKAALSRLGAAEAECSRLRRDTEQWRKAAGDEEDKALSASAALRDAERRHADYQQDLSAALSDCDTAKTKMKCCESSVATLTDEIDRSRVALQMKEQALQSERKKTHDLEGKLQSLEHANGNDRRLLRSKDEELDTQKSQIDACQKIIQTWQDKHSKAMAEVGLVADQARQHAALVEEYKKDLEAARLQLEDERSKRAGQDTEAYNLKQNLATAQSDVEQLKSLLLTSSRTQSHLDSRISTHASEQRAAQAMLEQAKDEVKQKQEELEKVKLHLTQSQSVVREVDSTRDRLQAELEDQAEQFSQLQYLHQQAQSHADELDVNRKAIEQRLIQADTQISVMQSEVQSAEERESICKQNLLALQQDYERLKDEITALSEDLAVMVKENQLITGQLGDATQSMENCRKDRDAAYASVSILQQTIKAREIDLTDMQTAYEGLAAEARHHEATISQLRRQLVGSAAELEAAKVEVTHVRETAHSSQQQIQQYIVDVQALERNTDALARELQDSRREAEELAIDRSRVLEQMTAVQGMRYEAERSRDILQQEVARLDSQLHISNSRLEDTHVEVRKYTSSNAILHNRISEFEKLAETMREKEFSMSQMMLQQHDDAAMDHLQVKCQNLQLQVHSMEQELSNAHKQLTSLKSSSRNVQHLQITDDPDDLGFSQRACQAELDDAQKQATAANQELAIVRRQLELAKKSNRHVAHPDSSHLDSDLEDRVAQLQRQTDNLEMANAELQSHATCLKDDKERLLRMVSRLELERHHLQTLQKQHSKEPSEHAVSSCQVLSGGLAEISATRQAETVSFIQSINKDHARIGALTNLTEMKDK